MVRIFQLFLVVFFALTIVSPVLAQTPTINPVGTEMFPKPGKNCGVAGDPAKDKCCISSLTGPNALRIDVDPVRDVFIIGGIVATFGDIVNEMIDAAPFFLIPSGLQDSLPVPSVRKLKRAVASIPRCIQPASPIPYVDSQGIAQCRCELTSPPSLVRFSRICENIKNLNERENCYKCITGTNTTNPGVAQGMWTSFGCIATASPKDFIERTILKLGLSLAGIAAFLCIIFAAIQLQISQGNPERLKKNQELLTSCIMGLMLIIFSIFILRLIGVTILRIPGLN